MPTIQIISGFLLSSVISLIAWRSNTLTKSGAWAAVVSGGLIFGLGGLPWAALLLTFFISSSLLSRLFSSQKNFTTEKYSKGSRRDWGQVLANGGLGAVLATGFWLLGEPEWIWLAFAGAISAVNADTWATELGVLNPTLPRMITNGKPVERGTSGAISLFGSMAALAGSLLVSLVAATFSLQLSTVAMMVAAVTLAGLGGSFADSYLGATVQAIYFCPDCKKETERHPLHTCGAYTDLLRGYSWLNNDLVNLFCSLVGAASAVLLHFVLTGF